MTRVDADPSTPDAAILSRLRRTGVCMVGAGLAGRELRRWLEERAVVVMDAASRTAALAQAKLHPMAPIVVFDDGQLDDVETFVMRLDRERSLETERRPVVLVVHARLHRGLAELGWRGGTHRVAFLRTESLVHDASLALVDLLSSEPEPRPGDPGLLTAVVRDVAEARFDVDALDAELRARLAWLGPVAERVLSSWVYRFQSPESRDGAREVDATLTVAWLDATGTRFSVSMQGVLVPARAAFQAKARRGWRAAFDALRSDRIVGDERFDEVFIVHADDAGLHEARGVQELLSRLPGLVDTLRWTEDGFAVSADDVPREELVGLLDAITQLWHRVARARLGLTDSQS